MRVLRYVVAVYLMVFASCVAFAAEQQPPSFLKRFAEFSGVNGRPFGFVFQKNATIYRLPDLLRIVQTENPSMHFGMIGMLINVGDNPVKSNKWAGEFLFQCAHFPRDFVMQKSKAIQGDLNGKIIDFIENKQKSKLTHVVMCFLDNRAHDGFAKEVKFKPTGFQLDMNKNPSANEWYYLNKDGMLLFMF